MKTIMQTNSWEKAVDLVEYAEMSEGMRLVIDKSQAPLYSVGYEDDYAPVVAAAMVRNFKEGYWTA